MRFARLGIVGVASLILVGTASAQGLLPPSGGGSQGPTGDGSLRVGSRPPEIYPGQWLMGSQINTLEEGEMYAVLMWSSEDGASATLLPALSELAERHPEVKFLAFTEDEPDTARGFLMRLGDRVKLNIAADDRNRTVRTWMRAARIQNFPYLFLIDHTRTVVWMGDPRNERFPEVVAMVAAGRYNPRLVEAAQPLLEQVRRFVRLREWRQADTYLSQVIEMDPYVFNTVAVERFRIMLVERGDVDGAIAYARGDFLTTYDSDPETIRLLARNIVTDRNWLAKDQERVLELAFDLASQAFRATNDARSLSVLALTNYRMGNVNEAIAQQRRAFLTANIDDKDDMKALLEQFQQGARLQGR